MFRSQRRRFDRSRPDHPAVERATAGHDGRPILHTRIRLSGKRQSLFRTGVDERSEPSSQIQSLLPYLLARLIDVIAQYEASGKFTPIEIRTMRFFVFSGWTEQRIADYESAPNRSVSKQAISSRLYGRKAPGGGRWGGIAKKAPEFIRAWELIKRYGR